MRTRLLAALAAVAVMSGTASATPPAPVYWQGTYGSSPFYARQIVTDAPNNFCAAPVFPWNLVVLVSGGYVCYAASASPAETAGGDFIAEYAICVGDPSKDYNAQFGNWENAFEIYDDTAGAIVREWTEPSTYAAHDFRLHAGDCAFWLWNLPMVTDAGTPLTSGHTHHVLFHNGTGPELMSAYFVAP